MNKIYKVIWSKVRNCYVAVSEIAKRNGKNCTSVNCGAKAKRRYAGMALAVALSLSMAGGGVAWAAESEFITPISSETMTITTDSTKVEGLNNVYKLQRTGGTIDSAAGTGVTFTVEGNEGKVYLITSYLSGNTIMIEEGGEVTTALRGGINNNSITVEGTAKNVAGGYIRQDTTYSGLGIMGNDVTNNTVTVKGNAVITGNELFGGHSYSGHATKNTIVINGGTVNVTNVYGGYSSSGNAGAAPEGNTKYGNTVNISGGTVGTVYGGYSGSGDALYNQITVSGATATIKGNVYGGWVNSGNGNALGNKVTVNGGTVTGDVYGGRVRTGIAGGVNENDGNIVTITDGTVRGEVRGGYNTANNDTPDNDGYVMNNRVIIENSIVGGTKEIYVSGGSAIKGASASKNSFTVGGTSTMGSTSYGVTIYGGYSRAADNNTVSVSGGTIYDKAIYGGWAKDGAATNNTIAISGGVMKRANLFAGYSEIGNADGNTVTIAGGSFSLSDDSFIIGSGRNQDGSSPSLTNNTVNLYGTVTGLDKAKLFGGCNGDNHIVEGTGNELHIGGTKNAAMQIDGTTLGPWTGKTTSNEINNKVNMVMNFNSIVLHKVNWSTTTPVLAAGSFSNIGNLDISGMDIQGTKTLGTMALLKSDTLNSLDAITLTYNNTTAGTSQPIGDGISLATISNAGSDTSTTGVSVAYDGATKVTRDSETESTSINYTISPVYTGATLGAMNWNEGYTFASGAVIKTGGLDVSFGSDFKVTGAENQANNQSFNLLNLNNSSGSISDAINTEKVTTLPVAVVKTGLTFAATRKDTIATDTNKKNLIYTTGTTRKVTTATFNGAITWDTTTPYYDASDTTVNNKDYTFDGDTAIDAGGLTITFTDAQKAALKKDDSMTLLSASGITTTNTVTPPTSNTVAVSNTSALGTQFGATATGTVAAETGAVKYKISSVDVNTITLGSLAWGSTDSLPETWTASGDTTINASGFNYATEPKATTALVAGDTATILTAQGLSSANDSKISNGTGKTVGIDTDRGNGVKLDATATGHVAAAENALNYVVDGITLNSIVLKDWNGATTDTPPTVPTGWTLKQEGETVVATINTNDVAPAEPIDSGEQRILLTSSAGYFTNIQLTGNKIWQAGGAFEETEASNGVRVSGTQTSGGVKLNEAASAIIYEAGKTNVTGIKLEGITFENNDKARSFNGEYDLTTADITIGNPLFTTASQNKMEAGDTMTIVDATSAISYVTSGQTLKDFDTTYSDVAFADTITDPTNSSTADKIEFAGKHTDTLSQDTAKTKLTYTVGDKVVDTATLIGPISWSDGTYYQNGTATNQCNRNSVFTFDSNSKIDISGVQFSATTDPLNKTMTLIGGNTINSVVKNVAGTITNGTPASFDVSLTINNTLLAASASGTAAINSGDLKFTVTGVTLDTITVKSVGDTPDTVPTGWDLKKTGSTITATVETGTGSTAMTPPSGLTPGETKVILTAGESLEGITINGDFMWKEDGSSLPTTAENGVAIAGTQTAGGVKVDDANKSQLIYEESKKTVTGITLGEITFAKDGTARAFDNTYDATAATINGDNLKFTEASAASMETGDTMTILDASAAVKSGGAALVAFADKSYTVAFSETNTDQNVTIAGTHSDTLSQDAAKTKLTYTVGTKDVNTVALGKVDFVKGSTLFDRSGAGYNYAGVAALGTDGFAVSYASPETIVAGDSMTLLQANATLKDMAEQVKKTSYSFAPVSGVTVDAAVTGSLEAKGGNVTYTATANQASKLTFTNVDWKDSGALMTRPSNITFAGADVDTTKINFQNVKELDANKKMTLVSDFGDSVGTITGTKYTVGAGLEGEGAASLSGSDLVFTTKTGARDLAAQEQTHNTLMVMEAGMAVLAAGNEYVGQTMAELGNPQNVGLDGTVTAASLGGSKSRYKTGSHVDSNNWNVAVAVGSKRELKKGSLEWGVFGEYGKSNYTLHSDAGRGDGDSHYAGGGLMAKWTNKHDVYTEASVRLGRLNDTASNLLRDATGNGYGYDVHANYFGAHVGIGKIIHYKGGKSLDVYGKYFYTKRDGVDFTSGGNNYSLDSVASSILRVGARYGTTDKKWNWYGGLAYEYEFDGKSEGTVDGIAIRAASVKGGSVRGEIGLRMSATKTNPWQTDISIYGYGGKHRGFGGSVNVAYMF